MDKQLEDITKNYQGIEVRDAPIKPDIDSIEDEITGFPVGPFFPRIHNMFHYVSNSGYYISQYFKRILRRNP